MGTPLTVARVALEVEPEVMDGVWSVPRKMVHRPSDSKLLAVDSTHETTEELCPDDSLCGARRRKQRTEKGSWRRHADHRKESTAEAAPEKMSWTSLVIAGGPPSEFPRFVAQKRHPANGPHRG